MTVSGSLDLLAALKKRAALDLRVATQAGPQTQDQGPWEEVGESPQRQEENPKAQRPAGLWGGGADHRTARFDVGL